MLKQLSYLNILLSMTYLLCFVTGGNFLIFAGIAVLLLFNSLVIKMIQEDRNFHLFHAVLGICCLCFWAYLTWGCIYIVQSAFSHQYFANIWAYLIPTSLFSLAILLQLFFCWRYFRDYQVPD
ncbi:hypothetical protein [Pedobacter gandavensis]|uniref:hypothetical protein n=1 Tax=Pedobacter gandavensis TaxID=2679963 RepID=UPI00292D67D0|nr:hypothetical protein [Pedobacter gandavensis]